MILHEEKRNKRFGFNFITVNFSEQGRVRKNNNVDRINQKFRVSINITRHW